MANGTKQRRNAFCLVASLCGCADLFRLHLGPFRNRSEANAMAGKIGAEPDFKPLVASK